MKNFIFGCFFIVLLSACGQNKADNNSQHISTFNDVENKAVLLDVRTQAEFNGGHLKNAQNIDVYDAKFAEKVAKFDKDEKIYVYCKMGGRSAQAQKTLNALGYTNVVNLEGGYDAWHK